MTLGTKSPQTSWTAYAAKLHSIQSMAAGETEVVITTSTSSNTKKGMRMIGIRAGTITSTSNSISNSISTPSSTSRHLTSKNPATSLRTATINTAAAGRQRVEAVGPEHHMRDLRDQGYAHQYIRSRALPMHGHLATSATVACRHASSPQTL